MNALFRCDATADIGFGHLSRCIALAEALRICGVRSTYAGKFDKAAQDQIDIAGFDTVCLAHEVNTATVDQELAGAIADGGIDLLVLDSYRADEGYLSGIRSLGVALIVIDDFGSLEAYPCDVILNFTWDAGSLGYPDDPVLLLGPEYLLARRGLVEVREQSIGRERPREIENLLIAIGGSDPKGIAKRLTHLLQNNYSRLCLRAIAEEGGDLAAMLNEFAPGSGVIKRQPDLSQSLLWADAALTGGGLIKYECAYMGVPAAAIAQNEGQDGESQSFARAGLVHDLGLADTVDDEKLAASLHSFLSDAELRTRLSARARAVFPPDTTAKAAKAILEAVQR
ncbi:PseG/SpsG family protein [Erythrobacter ani]|uniref:UDP-2,4-diacetamido-2,4, 6-trideoxy-beta-L-altropyranose hydrolase n=1 Tax=Erythrobacter ani TaxID=2827235 RepID=A0ABS6SIH6_9SPHN|nr:hypothetical protein [Erythrobacter ani]MBV7264814.1 hypothetical protein [Erythrobacter ani]